MHCAMSTPAPAELGGIVDLDRYPIEDPYGNRLGLFQGLTKFPLQPAD